MNRDAGSHCYHNRLVLRLLVGKIPLPQSTGTVKDHRNKVVAFLNKRHKEHQSITDHVLQGAIVNQ